MTFSLTTKKQKISSIVIDLLFLGLIYVIFFVFNLEIIFRIIFTTLTIILAILNTWIMFGSSLTFDQDNQNIVYLVFKKQIIPYKEIHDSEIHRLSDKQHDYQTIALYDKNKKLITVIKTFISSEKEVEIIQNQIKTIINNNR